MRCRSSLGGKPEELVWAEPKRNHENQAEYYKQTLRSQTCLRENLAKPIADTVYRSDLEMALISPGIVYSAASMSTGNPNSRRVDEVTGPMEASRHAF